MSGDSDQPSRKHAKLATSLDQLKDYTTVVADTGDFEGWLLHALCCLGQPGSYYIALIVDNKVVGKVTHRGTQTL